MAGSPAFQITFAEMNPAPILPRGITQPSLPCHCAARELLGQRCSSGASGPVDKGVHQPGPVPVHHTHSVPVSSGERIYPDTRTPILKGAECFPPGPAPSQIPWFLLKSSDDLAYCRRSATIESSPIPLCPMLGYR